jgi:CubicO group peptidase (beta-lactamase class C family)
MDTNLNNFVEETAKKFKIPGVAVGVWADGKEAYAYCGITSSDNPLPVDQSTLFILGSVTKTYTATTLMRLVAEGKVDLNAPAQLYVPELKLADQEAEKKITVLQLLNHTSGLDWGVIGDFGEGDDALARYAEKMYVLKQIARPGTRVSYSQAGYNLIGRIIEKVTGQTFEQAVTTLVFDPLGLSESFFARDDIMTRRFAVGHNRSEDGTLSVARLWRRSRGDNPGGGITSSVRDQLQWARFHLGSSGNENNIPVLNTERLHQMKVPTAELRASNLGDAIGIGWFLRTIDGVHTIGHGGSANGQFADVLLVPERNFAVVSLSNAGPDGIPFNKEVICWTLKHYLGIIDRDLEPVAFDPLVAKEFVGNYENEVMTLDIDTTSIGLRLEVLMKPEIRAAADKELPPDHTPFNFGLLAVGKDEYIITSGAFKGQRGFFARDTNGAITGIDLAGRLFNRISKE